MGIAEVTMQNTGEEGKSMEGAQLTGILEGANTGAAGWESPETEDRRQSSESGNLIEHNKNIYIYIYIFF